MGGFLLGIGLMVVGGVLLLFGRSHNKRVSVHASGGSVAIGGSNSGTITNTNTNINQPNKSHGGGHKTIAMIGALIELIGIAVTVWHAMHMAGKW